MIRTDTIQIPVNIDSNIAEQTAQANSLGDQLQDIAAASRRVAGPVAQARAAQEAGAITGRESSTARGIGGMTGAAGRDFAAQAQGLGGLVHVYATFAANLFAISTAFNALSKAMDTANMLKGLDQLGAASGRNLGTLSKRLVDVTDGAIAMRDAMTAVAQASAGGMSGDNILRMGEVAKKASQALGIDMPNAVSRLSRGITKLEPELLDELGIMVKIEQSSRDYARTLGKSASALTDFEKRQGFANAVLAEGEKKFGAIQLMSNPYSKILASTQNLLQSTLELVNKGLGPLVDLLASSPTALATALSGLGTMLLKQALPAINAYREGAKKAAAASLGRLASISEDQHNLRIQAALDASDKAEKIYREDAANAAKIEAMKGKLVLSEATKTRIKYNDILKKSAYDITQEEIKQLKARATALSKMQDVARQQEATALRAHLQEIEKIQADSIKVRADAANDVMNRQAVLDSKGMSHAAQSAKIYNKAVQAASNDRIKALVAETAAIEGPRAAWKKLNEEIAKSKAQQQRISIIDPKTGETINELVPKTGALTNGMTRLAGAIRIAAIATTTFVNAFQTALIVVGLIVAAFALLNDWLTSNAKEAEAFAKSLDALNESGENVARTLDAINNKKASEFFSPESIQARATAFNELSDSVTKAAKDFDKVQAAAGKWDRFWDAMKDPFGFSNQDKMAEGLATAVVDSLRLLEDKGLDEEVRKTFQDILGKGVDLASRQSIEKALSKLSTDDFINAQSRLAKSIQDTNQKINNSASALTSYVNKLTEIEKIIGNISTELIATDNLSKLGAVLISSSNDLNNLFKSPMENFAALVKLMNDSRASSLLGGTRSAQLAQDVLEVNKLNDAIGIYTKQLKDAREAEAKAQVAFDNRPTSGLLGENYLSPERTQLKQDLDDAKALVASTQAALAKSQESVNTFLDAYKNVNVEIFQKGAELIAQSYTKSVEDSRRELARNALSQLNALGGVTADLENKLVQEEINSQIDLINVNFELIKAIKLDTISREKSTLVAKALEITNTMGPLSPEQLRFLDALPEAVASLTRQEELLKLSAQDLASAFVGSGTRGKSGKFDFSGADSATQAAYRALGDVFQQAIGAATKIIAARAKGEQSDINSQIKKVYEEAKVEKEGLEHGLSGNAALNMLLEQVKLQEKLAVFFDEKLVRERQSLETQKRSNDFAKQMIDVNATLAAAELSLLENKKRSGADSEAAKRAQAEVDTAEARRLELIATQEQAKINARIAQEMELEEGKDANIKRRLAYFDKLYELQKELTGIELTSQENQLDRLSKIEALSAVEEDRRRTSLALAKEELSHQQQRAAIIASSNNTMIDLRRQKMFAEKYGNTGVAAEIQQQIDAEEHLQKVRLDNLDEANKTRTKNIQLNGVVSAQLAEQKDMMVKINALSASLNVEWSNFINSLSGVVDKLGEIYKTQTDYEAKRKTLSETAENESASVEDRAQAVKDLAALDKKNAADQLKSVAGLAKASAKMFGEKTAAYKVLMALDKTATALSIANNIKELASNFPVIISKVQGAVANIWESVPPWVAGALTVGFLGMMASLGFKKGGGAVPTAGRTAADRQETQGTGMTWRNGEKVESGGGVFGDAEAKSESITKSIETIKDNMIFGLKYDLRMVKALENMEAAIVQSANTLYSIKGVRTGSFGGVVEGTSSGGGVLSSIGLGSKISKSIIDSGIEFSGTISDLMDGVKKDTITFYQDVLVTKNRKFGRDKSWIETHRMDAPDAVRDEFANIFKEAEVVFQAIGKEAGYSANKISEEFGRIPLDTLNASIRGLKGEELAKELEAVIGSTLSTAASRIFAEFEPFKKAGEDYLETVIRVTDGHKKVKVGLESIGVATSKIEQVARGFIDLILGRKTGLEEKFNYQVSQALIEGAGGLENFTSQLEFFRENIMTEAERLEDYTRTVKSTLADLGLSWIDSREELKEYIKTLDLTTEADRRRYQALMDLAPVFVEVYKEEEEAVKKVISAEELRTKKLQQMTEILKLLNRNAEATNLQRLQELATLPDSLKSNQLYIYALQDEIALKNELEAAYQKQADTINANITAIKSNVDALRAAIKTLKEYRDALLMGSLSPLNPQERYEQAALKVTELAKLANAEIDPNNAAATAAKFEAINAFPAAADAFLESSRTLLASSSQYNQDFNSILSLIDSTTAKLGKQLTTEELALQQLEASVALLVKVEQNTREISLIIADLARATGAREAAERYWSNDVGSFTSEMYAGANLTPEQQDVMNRIMGTYRYTPYSSTEGATINGEPVGQGVTYANENQAALNKQIELLTLLTQQLTTITEANQKQASDIITTNYDANARAATTVSTAVNEAAKNVWVTNNVAFVPAYK